MGRPALLPGQPCRQDETATQARRQHCATTCRCDPRTHRGDGGAACATGNGQGHGRWARHEGHASHFRDISKNGRLDIEDERGGTVRGKESLCELSDDWRFRGTLIDDNSDWREAFNIMLSMPRGTDPLIVQKAAREFAQIELADHKYLMALHDHQADPHAHISGVEAQQSG